MGRSPSRSTWVSRFSRGENGTVPITPSGFTLVELLVVIVIIGILASLLTGAVVASRAAARRAVIRSEINQLQMALEQYKNQVGEYPPDFSWLNEDNDPTNDTAAEAAAKAVLTRHLRRRFPRYAGDWDAAANDVLLNYSVDITQLDPASALAFWLGGLPEEKTGTRPAGFHADPTNPFRPGLPRTQAFYDFDPERLEYTSGSFLTYRYHPRLPAGIPETPYIYFRSARHNQTGEHSYLFTYMDTTSTPPAPKELTRYWQHPDPLNGVAVPYRSGKPAAGKIWRAEGTYQIISSGLDGAFTATSEPVLGPGLDKVLDVNDASTFPVTITGPFTSGDFDNMASFAAGKLEDELQ